MGEKNDSNLTNWRKANLSCSFDEKSKCRSHHQLLCNYETHKEKFLYFEINMNALINLFYFFFSNFLFRKILTTNFYINCLEYRHPYTIVIFMYISVF